MTPRSLKSLSILSHKGGVGKTSIAINLATYLAKEGMRVCLLENDFHGPSLNTWWKPEVVWLNEYLLGTTSIENCLQDFSSELRLSGKLYVGFADPNPETIKKIISINEKTSMTILKNLIKIKNLLKQHPYEIDYMIIDCSPGIGYSAINAMLATNTSLFIVKLSNADIIGTSRLMKGLLKQLKKRTLVLANLIPKDAINDKYKKTRAQQLIEQNFKQDLEKDLVVEFLGWIPTDDKLSHIEFEKALETLNGQEPSRIIYTLDQPKHIFATTLIDLIPKLFND